jgi:hypothetical protein
MDGPPPDDDQGSFEPLEVDGDDEGASQVGTLLGALGQIAAAALVVLAVVALFIGVAAAVRWLLH